jgi:SAM-dependent methyltransferase
MGAKAHRRDWEDLAELDLYWAALTDRTKRSGAWDRAEFLATGEREIEGLLRYAAELGYPRGREAALDFGCGPGRLTRALALRFREAVGVDVSSRMVREAREINADVPNCRFEGADAMDRFAGDSFDLVYSNLVLQHVSDGAAVAGYVAEFVRLLAPGGLLATFSCSGGVPPELFQSIVAGAALDAGADAKIIERFGAAADHPVALEFPEGEYLKGLLLVRS